MQLFRAAEAISHSGKTNIEGKADGELTVGDIAASLHDIIILNFKSGWVVNLFKIAGEVALVVVLPLDEARDLIGKL